MSLASALPGYKSDLESVFQNPNNTADTAAQQISDFTLSWGIQGVPMTVDTGSAPKGLAAGQTVLGAVTVSPGSVTADGIGGIDSSSPGSGLAAAKPALKSDLEAIFSNSNNSASLAAQQISAAIDSFFSKAKIMTDVTGTVAPGAAVPPPVGPVGTAPYTGSGTGGVDSSSPGAGLSASVSAFKSSLLALFQNSNNSISSAAQQIADAAETFFLTGNVNTTNSGTAGGGPAVVSVAPPQSGTTSAPGSPSSGNSTIGTIS